MALPHTVLFFTLRRAPPPPATLPMLAATPPPLASLAPSRSREPRALRLRLAAMIRGGPCYEIITFRGACEFCSRNDFFVSSSCSVGWTRPLVSVARETSVCAPGVAFVHV